MTRPSACPPAGKRCARSPPCSAPPFLTGRAIWSSWWVRATWSSRYSRPGAPSRVRSSARPRPAGRAPARDQCLASPPGPDRGALGPRRRTRPAAPARPGPGVLTGHWASWGSSRSRRIVVPMAQAVTPHQVTALIARCYAGLDASGLRQEVLRRLRQMMSVDAAFFATVDPETLLFTSAVADEPLRAATPLFLGNEFGRNDVNKFARLAEAADPVSSLDRATQGSRPQSASYREIMSPLGLGDELRAALLAGKTCWGVLCLHREDAARGFAPGDLDLVRRISRHLAK